MREGSSMLIVKEDLLQSFMIYNDLTVSLSEGEEIKGRLRTVSDKYIELYVNGICQKVLWKDILSLDISNNSEFENIIDESLSWWKERRHFATDAKYSLGNCFRNLFDDIAERMTDSILIALFEAKNSKKLIYIDEKEKINYLRLLEPVLNQIKASEVERSAARALIYLAAKDYATGMKELAYKSLGDSTFSLLPMICFYQDMKDGTAAFYWLSRYYNEPVHIQENDDLWWNYLLQTVSFDYYDDLIPQLLHLYNNSNSKAFAIRSLAFLFFACNDNYKGNFLYTEANKKNSHMSKMQYSKFLISLRYGTSDGEYYTYYARYRRWLEMILDRQSPLYKSYERNDDIHGFVYEFIPGKGYCMVLGYDLLSYFLHFDDCAEVDANNTRSIKNRLQREICSFSPVHEELPVCLSFSRTDSMNTKKSYAIIRAELSAHTDF